MRLNLDLQPVWKLVCEAIDELSGQATSSPLSVFKSFFRFCEITKEDHLKFAEPHMIMLNQLIRDDIYLLDNSFSLLWKTPEVIDFANKRKYFKAKVFEDGPSYFEPTLEITCLGSPTICLKTATR